MSFRTFLYKFSGLVVLSCIAVVSYGEKVYQVSISDKHSGEAAFVLDLLTEQQVAKVVFKPVGNRSRKTFEFGPFEPGHHVLLAYFPVGRYELQSVAVPHYDLPYRYDYDKFENTSFSVRKKTTAYFGQIIVGESRGKNSLDIRVSNRIAMMSPVFARYWKDHLSQNPLFFAGQHRDHFADTFLTN